MKSRRFFIIAMIAPWAASCATSPTQSFWDRARQVTVGMTEAEVIALLGKPNEVLVVGKNITWKWSAFTVGGGYRWLSLPMREGKIAAVPALPFD